jgi:Flagellar basal body-associated protein FliL
MIKPSHSRRPIIAMLALGTFLSWPMHGKAAEEAHPNKPTFVSLGDFTVNLPEEGGASSYVVIGITLEVAPEVAGDFTDLAPRMKDMVIRRLMVIAAQGMLQPGHTDPVMLKTLLFDSFTKLHPDGVREVLITRLVYG